MADINSQIREMTEDLKTFFGNHKGAMELIHKRLDNIEYEQGRAPSRRTRESGGDRIAKALVGDGNMEMLRKSGRIRLEVADVLPTATKATILSSGLYAPEAAQGVQAFGRFPFRLRSLIPTLPIETGATFVLRQSGRTNGASPQVEGSAKGESTYAFTPETLPIRTVAHFVNVSRQSFDDVPGLAQFLDSELIFGLESEIEQQILHGSGVSEDLEGLTTYGAAFDTSLLGTGWDRMAVIAAAAAQIRANGYTPTHFVVHPHDWLKIETTRTVDGYYVAGDPRSSMPIGLWGLEGVVSSATAEGSFVVFDINRVLIRERLAVEVVVSEEHNDNFTKNLYTVRAEWRGAQVVSQAQAVVSGSLNSSPA